MVLGFPGIFYLIKIKYRSAGKSFYLKKIFLFRIGTCASFNSRIHLIITYWPQLSVECRHNTHVWIASIQLLYRLGMPRLYNRHSSTIADFFIHRSSTFFVKTAMRWRWKIWRLDSYSCWSQLDSSLSESSFTSMSAVRHNFRGILGISLNYILPNIGVMVFTLQREIHSEPMLPCIWIYSGDASYNSYVTIVKLRRTSRPELLSC